MNTNHPPTHETPTRRRTAIATTAGVLGGGAVGLLMMMPNWSSAASEDTVAATDDIVASAPAEGDPIGTRPESGERLRELLDELVPGTITAEQADAVAEHLVANRPDPGEFGRHGHHGRRGGPAFDGEVVAGLLGIDADTLREELRAGSSIADLAAEQGVALDTIVAALVDEAEEHLDLAVENGRLTEEEATERLADVEDHITDMVNGELGPHGRGPGFGAGATDDASA